MKTKTTITVLAVVLSLAMIITSLCLYAITLNNTMPSLPDQTPDIVTNDSMFINNGETDGMLIASTKIASESYADYGVTPLAETAYTLTATITPASAYVQGITWSIAWVNASSEWASGKSITNYVTITPSGSNNHTATVSCVSSFSERIKITAASDDNENIKAECYVDYGRRFRNMGGRFIAQRTIGGTQTTEQYYDFSYSDVAQVEVVSGGRNPVYSNKFSGSYTLSDGTITPNVTEEYVLQMSDGLIAALERQGLTTTFTDTVLTDSKGMMFDRVCIADLLGINYTLNPEEWAKLAAAIADNNDSHDFKIKYTVSSDYDVGTTYARIKLSSASMLAVTNVSLDNSLLVF